MTESTDKPKKLNKKLIASIVIGAVVCLVMGGWSAFIADDNNLLQGADTQLEIEKRKRERQNELVYAFIVGGIPWGLGAGALTFIALRYLRKTS